MPTRLSSGRYGASGAISFAEGIADVDAVDMARVRRAGACAGRIGAHMASII